MQKKLLQVDGWYVLILGCCSNTLWGAISRVGRVPDKYTSSKCNSADVGRGGTVLHCEGRLLLSLVFVHQVSSEKHLIATTRIAFVFFSF